MLDLWTGGTASYTFLIGIQTLQTSLMMRYINRKHVASVVMSLVNYVAFLFLLSTFSLEFTFLQTDSFGIMGKLGSVPQFYMGVIITPVLGVLPNYIINANKWFDPIRYPHVALMSLERRELAKGAQETGEADGGSEREPLNAKGYSTFESGRMSSAASSPSRPYMRRSSMPLGEATQSIKRLTKSGYAFSKSEHPDRRGSVLDSLVTPRSSFSESLVSSLPRDSSMCSELSTPSAIRNF